MSPNALILLQVINTGLQAWMEWSRFQQDTLLLLQKAQAEGRDVTPEELSGALHRQMEAFAKAEKVYAGL